MGIGDRYETVSSRRVLRKNINNSEKSYYEKMIKQEVWYNVGRIIEESKKELLPKVIKSCWLENTYGEIFDYRIVLYKLNG